MAERWTPRVGTRVCVAFDGLTGAFPGTVRRHYGNVYSVQLDEVVEYRPGCWAGEVDRELAELEEPF